MIWNTSNIERNIKSLSHKKWFWTTCSAVTIGVICAILLYFNVTLNFTILGLLVILLWLLVFGGYNMFQNKSRKPRTNGMFVTGKENAEFAMISCFSLLVIGVLAIHTLNNYFYPEESVYRNIDHHVVRVDGIQILNPHEFVLAENSSAAFLDSRKMIGKISIASCNDSDSITLRLDRCTRALYKNRYDAEKRCDERYLLNQNQLLHFNDGDYRDTLFMQLSNGQILKFYTQICKDNGFLQTPRDIPFTSRKLILKHRKDSAIYALQLPDTTYYSDEHKILTAGMSLNDLLKGIDVPDIDLSGINIVRPIIYPIGLNDMKVYNYDSIGYNVEYVGGTNSANLQTVAKIRSTKSDWQLIKTNPSQTITIPYGEAISLGAPMNSNQHIYFTKDSLGHIALKYRQPKRAYLPGEIKDKKFNSVYVTSSLAGDAKKLQFVPEQIILFDEFEKFDNVNNMTPFILSYIAGPTTQRLELIAQIDNRQDTITTGRNGLKQISDIASLNGNLLWQIGIENLNETSPCKIADIKRNIILLTISLAILILFGSVRFLTDSEDREKRNTYSFPEFVIYSLILYLLTFRWFLLWRTSVFLPVENVSYYEYETLFRGYTNMRWLNIFSIIFIVVVVILKLVFITDGISFLSSWIKTLAAKPFPKKISYEVTKTWNKHKEWFRNKIGVRCVTIGHSIYSVLQRWKHRMVDKLPLKVKECLTYIKKELNSAFHFIYVSTPKLTVPSFVLIAGISFIFRGQPAISITAAVMGYILSVAYCNKKLLGHYKLEDQQCDDLSSAHPFAHYLCSVIINTLTYTAILFVIDSGYSILFITFSIFYIIWLLHEYVTSYMSEETYSIRRDWWVVLLFGCFITLLFLYRELFHFILDSNVWLVGIVFFIAALIVLIIVCNKILNIQLVKKSVCIIIVCSILIGCVGVAFHEFLPKKATSTTERIMVHFAKPTEAMGTKRTEKEMQKYMEAALNHMIMGEYEIRGHEVKILGEHSYGYFKMQPHSKVGALWNAQLTDISLVRYCIAEHGRWLPFCFMLAFIFLLFASIRMPLYHRWARTILIMVPLLFTVQSLLIWMANTQRFVFLGQDFPLVSINSRLTLTFFFGLTILWIAILLYEKINFYQLYEDNDDAYDLRLDNDWRYEVARRDSLKVGTIMLMALTFCAVIQHVVKTPNNTFEVEELMNKVQTEVNKTINPLLKEYQKKNGCIPMNHPNIHNDIAQFDKQMNVDETIQQNISDSSCYLLIKNLWRDYVENGSKKNSSSLVLHARVRQDTIHKDSLVEKFPCAQIRIITKYYDKHLPKQNQLFWKGSFVTRSFDQQKILTAQYGSSTQSYPIPNDWLENENSAIILSGNVGRYNAIVKNGNQTAYLARNVRVNGRPMFIYPLEEKFYWIRNFAEQIANQKNNMDIRDRADDFDDNIELTISASLTNKLYDYLKESQIEDPSIIVSNGDGEVVAMVSYDKEYHLNPNDNKTILSLYDSLYMNGLNGSQLEQRAFANRNLIYLPGGPGSSQKPLLWTAVASAIDYPWKHLTIAPFYGKIEDADEKHFKVEKFNNHMFKKSGFKVLKSDENGGNGVTLEGFMTHSSNIYNALMAYIGSFSSADQVIIDEMRDINATRSGDKMFAYTTHQVRRMSSEEYRELFPIMYRSNMRASFAFDAFPDYKKQENSILEKQMRRMFLDDKNINYKIHQSSTAGDKLSLNKIINNFAYCAQSSLHSRGDTLHKFMENGIRSTAIGSQAVWDITPWKMAESYGRMASLNRNYTLSVIKPTLSYRQYDMLSDGYKDARGTLMRGMGKVLTASNGTARFVKLNFSTFNGSKINKIGDYYLYAKTGTTDNGLNKDYYKEHHRLGIIIANQDLANTPIEDLNQVKYYIVYFAVHNVYRNPLKWDLYADCIKEIMNSEEFNTYMEGK